MDINVKMNIGELLEKEIHSAVIRFFEENKKDILETISRVLTKSSIKEVVEEEVKRKEFEDAEMKEYAKMEHENIGKVEGEERCKEMSAEE